MRFVDIIRAKRDGSALERDQIEAFIAGVTDGSVPEYQISALLMAIVLRGMSAEETAWLTDAMVRSGTSLDLSDLPGVKVDKHSTGGVGDKTSLVLAPLAAACGAIVPMMSGRGLGHTGGTLDKLEAIPGFRVSLSLDELRASLRSVGCALVGQTSEIAPADKRLYALRDVTATVESLPLITASIMSKKIAEGIGGLVLDVKVGQGAFMRTDADARRLAESLVAVGTAAGVRTEALITAMDAPLGRTVGNALEILECTETLKGHGPADLTDLSVLLAARMLVLAGIAPTEADAEQRVRGALMSGAGLDKWRQIIANQGGDPRVVEDHRLLPRAPFRHVIAAPRSGYLTALDAGLVGRAAVALGAGRSRVDEEVDPAVGATLQAKPGARVAAGDPIVVLHYRHERDLGPAVDLVTQAIRIEDEAPAPASLVRGHVSG
jgi:pyrimidine-nucleoside phosphorylase